MTVLRMCELGQISRASLYRCEFERLLASHGANVIESDPLSLNEIFLELCRTSEGFTEKEAGA
jgi:hypothetical protein